MAKHTICSRGVALAVILCGIGAGGVAHAVGNVVISQVDGGGGNSGAPLQNNFLEVFNRSASAVDVTGWSVQYASATGTGNFAGNPIAALSGVLQPRVSSEEESSACFGMAFASSEVTHVRSPAHRRVSAISQMMLAGDQLGYGLVRTVMVMNGIIHRCVLETLI